MGEHSIEVVLKIDGQLQYAINTTLVTEDEARSVKRGIRCALVEALSPNTHTETDYYPGKWPQLNASKGEG